MQARKKYANDGVELEEANYLDSNRFSEAYEKKTGIKPVFMAAQRTNVERFRNPLICKHGKKTANRKIYPNYLRLRCYTWTEEEK